jgi:DNA-binding SARP family transcriptional activator
MGSLISVNPAARIGRDPAAPEGFESGWPILICLLGSFRVLKGGEPVSFRRGSKARALLVNLSVSRGQCTSRDALLKALWPGGRKVPSKQSLHKLVHTVHKTLGDAIDGAPPILHADGYYRLNVEAGVGIDVACFDILARAGEQQARSGNFAAAAAARAQAVRLYRGDLYAGPGARAVTERQRVRTLYLTLLLRLAEYHHSAGAHGECLNAALQLLKSDPYREDAHRMVIGCHLRRGEWAQALRQYRLCEAMLRAEFDAEPEPATTALLDQVRLDHRSI